MIKNFKAGETIITEGAVEKGFYILLRGRFGIYKNGKLVSETGSEGSTIGELSGILTLPRTATVVAQEATSVVYVEADIERLIKDNPDITRNIILNLAERLNHTTQKLAELTEVFDYTNRRKQ